MTTLLLLLTKLMWSSGFLFSSLPTLSLSRKIKAQVCLASQDRVNIIWRTRLLVAQLLELKHKSCLLFTSSHL